MYTPSAWPFRRWSRDGFQIIDQVIVLLFPMSNEKYSFPENNAEFEAAEMAMSLLPSSSCMLPCQAENLKEKKSGRRDVFISRGRFIFYSQRSVIFVDRQALEQRVKRCLLNDVWRATVLQNFSMVTFLLSLGLCSIIWLKTHTRFIGIHLAERQADLWK